MLMMSDSLPSMSILPFTYASPRLSRLGSSSSGNADALLTFSVTCGALKVPKSS